MKVKGKVTALDVVSYIQGHITYLLYYSVFHFIIPKHIREQIKSRISSMNPECYLTGNCVVCGCKTTQLQMAHKRCDAYCYPSFLKKSSWNTLKNGGVILKNGYLWTLENEVFIKKEVTND